MLDPTIQMFKYLTLQASYIPSCTRADSSSHQGRILKTMQVLLFYIIVFLHSSSKVKCFHSPAVPLKTTHTFTLLQNQLFLFSLDFITSLTYRNTILTTPQEVMLFPGNTPYPIKNMPL